MDYKIEAKADYRFIYLPELRELGLYNCFTTKDMDIGRSTNESIDDIRKSYEYIYDFIGIRPKEQFSGYQVHSGNVVSITDMSQGECNGIDRIIAETDGLITNINNIALISRFADCTPILLYDPIKKIQANIHSGWKGTLQRIASNSLDIMVNKYGSNPKDIIGVLGPTIGRNDFEVEYDVMNMFKEEFDYYKDIIRQKNEIKFLIDLHTTIKRMLLDKGIKEDNLTTIDLSTYAEEDLFHSYRRDKEAFGIMGAITILK
ncbi:MAG: peptidoglycan editing factor PgeF, partial [Tissierellia bacterium]|nr:peptidoglycan editing factor PgeF [Tissierellia bacterium]MDD4726886.1 peptidoglycan editing factor PgeF [Tissierellia bacterium]